MESKPLKPPANHLYYERHLPHYQPPEAVLFITFRLARSIPLHLLDELQQQVEAAGSEAAGAAISGGHRGSHQGRIFARWDQILGAADFGPTWLVKPAVAQIVQESLHHRDGKEYDLFGYCIMPNHVHLVCRPLAIDGKYCPIGEILQSLKGYTAYRANRILGRKGPFWQHESYDHVVRNGEEYRRVMVYVLNNPVMAGLVERAEDWKWSYEREQG